MNNDQINLVQTSFAKVVPISETAAELFYGRLFEIAPEVRPLFKGDMKDRGKKLMATLNVAVQSLTDLPKLVPVLEKLAIGHVPYGVKAEHYDKVGAALLWTLEQGLGERAPCRRELPRCPCKLPSRSCGSCFGAVHHQRGIRNEWWHGARFQ